MGSLDWCFIWVVSLVFSLQIRFYSISRVFVGVSFVLLLPLLTLRKEIPSNNLHNSCYQLSRIAGPLCGLPPTNCCWIRHSAWNADAAMTLRPCCSTSSPSSASRTHAMLECKPFWSHGPSVVTNPLCCPEWFLGRLPVGFGKVNCSSLSSSVWVVLPVLWVLKVLSLLEHSVASFQRNRRAPIESLIALYPKHPSHKDYPLQNPVQFHNQNTSRLLFARWA